MRCASNWLSNWPGVAMGWWWDWEYVTDQWYACPPAQNMISGGCIRHAPCWCLVMIGHILICWWGVHSVCPMILLFAIVPDLTMNTNILGVPICCNGVDPIRCRWHFMEPTPLAPVNIWTCSLSIHSSQFLLLPIPLSFYSIFLHFLLMWASAVRVWVAIICYRHVTLWPQLFP